MNRFILALASLVGFAVFVLGVGGTSLTTDTVEPDGAVMAAGAVIMLLALGMSWQLDRLDDRRSREARP